LEQHGIASVGVLLDGYRVQMGWVAALACTAEVIKHQSVFDRATEVLEGDSVNHQAFALDPYPAIAVTVEFADPLPAASALVHPDTRLNAFQDGRI